MPLQAGCLLAGPFAIPIEPYVERTSRQSQTSCSELKVVATAGVDALRPILLTTARKSSGIGPLGRTRPERVRSR